MPLPKDHGVHGRGTAASALDKGRHVSAMFAMVPVPAIEPPPTVALPETEKRDAALTRHAGHRIAQERSELPEPDDVDRKDDWRPEEPGESAERVPGDDIGRLRRPHPSFGLLGLVFGVRPGSSWSLGARLTRIGGRRIS